MLKVKLRMDYKGTTKSSYFFFGNRSPEKMAAEVRDQQTNMLKNIPIQGINIEEINTGAEIYTVHDTLHGSDEVAYAPAEIIINADSLEDLVRFIMREEFRKIEILDPPELLLKKHDMERMFFKVNEELKCLIPTLIRKLER